MMNASSYDTGSYDVENNGSSYLSKPPPEEPMMGDDSNPGFDRGHSLPNLEELRISNASSAANFDEEGRSFPKGKRCTAFVVAFLLALVVIGASLGIALTMENEERNNVVSSATSEAGNTQAPKEDGGGKEPVRDIDDAPPSIPTAPPTVAVTVPPGTDVERRYSAMKSFLESCGISEEQMSTEGSSHYLALEFMAEKDGLFLDVPDQKDSPEGYTFLTRYVLTLMYYTLNGPQWLFNLNFLRPATVCAWYTVLQYMNGEREFRGVACNPDTMQVESLFLNQNKLVGTLPSELSLLTTIINVDFNINEIRGTIPSEWEALSDMKNIFLSANEITGEFPAWLEKYTNLRNINFSHNNMEGSLPTFLGKFTNLVGLALDNNLFTSLEGVFDTSLVPGLRNLEQLYLEDNQFTETLDEHFVGELKALKYLDISDNRFAGRVPSHLFEMPNLLVLDLHDNDFSELPQNYQLNDKLQLLALQKCNFEDQKIPASLSNLRNLEHLDLSQNGFTGDIPASIGSLKNLTYLFLAQNDFLPGAIPQWIGDLTSLEELSMKSTQRTGSIPDFFGSLSELVLLDLDDNGLTGEIPASIGNLRDLTILLLNRNNLNSTIPQSFSQLRKLRLIFLDNNDQITGNLGTAFCNNPTMQFKPIIVANCDICDPFQNCCDECCQDGEECNEAIHVPDLDPIWQLSYDRKFYTFNREDYFPKEVYQNGED